MNNKTKENIKKENIKKENKAKNMLYKETDIEKKAANLSGMGKTVFKTNNVLRGETSKIAKGAAKNGLHTVGNQKPINTSSIGLGMKLLGGAAAVGTAYALAN